MHPIAMTLPVLTQQDPLALAAAWLLVAIVLLERFDISLPRGDSVGVSGALAASGLLVLGPAVGSLTCLVAFLLARVGQATHRSAAALARRVAGLSAGCAVAITGFRSDMPDAFILICTPLAYLLFEFAVAQSAATVSGHRSLRRLLAGNLERQAPVLAAEAATSILAVITYGVMGVWSLVPVVLLLLLIRQSYALLLEIRETYRTTIEVLVEAAEGLGHEARGHAERTAQIARGVAEQMGLSSRQVERVSYAALLHDLGSLSGSSADSMNAADVLEGTTFFADIVPVLKICAGDTSDASVGEHERMIALIVALASDADWMALGVHAPAHEQVAVEEVSPQVPASAKARVVGAALKCGLQIPAIR